MAFAMIYPKSPDKERTYKRDDDDLEDNESDATKFSLSAEVFDKTYLLPTRQNLDLSESGLAQRRAAKRAKELGNFWIWLRWGVIIGLQTVLILLLSVSHEEERGNCDKLPDLTGGDQTVETGGDINGLYKTRKSIRSFCFAKYSSIDGRQSLMSIHSSNPKKINISRT